MGDGLKAVIDEIVKRIRARSSAFSIVANGQSQEVKLGNRVIKYVDAGDSAKLVYSEDSDASISIEVIEQNGKSHFIYRFHPSRREDVKRYFQNAGVLGSFLRNQIVGYDPKYDQENPKRLISPLPQKNPFKELPDLIEQHISQES